MARKGRFLAVHCGRRLRSTGLKLTTSSCPSLAQIQDVIHHIRIIMFRFVVEIVEDVGSAEKIVTEGLFRKPASMQRAKADLVRVMR